MVMSSLWPRTKSKPSRMADQNGGLTLLGVSLTGTPRRMDAEIINKQAFANRAIGAPVNLINAPAAAGPVTSAVAEASAFFACASTKRERGTICVRTICAALPAGGVTAPITNATTQSQGLESHPSHQAIGTVATPRAIDNSPKIYTGSFLTRSNTTPVGNENSAKGMISIAVKSPICVGAACMSTAAVNGMASRVTWPPNEEISIEVQSLR